MIVVAPTANFVKRGRPLWAAPVLSDQPPPAGTVELLSFGVKIGVHPRSLRRRGTAHEHFNLMCNQVRGALAAGGTRIDRYRLVEIVAIKTSAIDFQVLCARCGVPSRPSYVVAR